MSDIVSELRERALQAEQDGEPIALLDEAAGEIERLRSWVRIQDAVIRSGNVAALTDAEREVIVLAAETWVCKPKLRATLCGLLDRLK